MNTVEYYKDKLYKLHTYAKAHSTCCKAQVGAMIIKSGKILAYKCNTSMPDNCKKQGCHRIKVYGEDSKLHRLPSDCYALHAEINAIATAARIENTSVGTHDATMYVTRYPCEACARAIVAAGIDRVIYSGIEKISDQTRDIFKNGNVEVIYVPIIWGGDTVD